MIATNNYIESKKGMSQVVIDMSPQVKHQDGHGREVLADVYFRINIQAYTDNLYTYTKEAREESEKACEAYYSEVVEMLKAEGWTLRKEKYGVGDCPQMVKGTQYLYCHPQEISGNVNPADIEALEAKIKALTSCKFYKTDNYGDIIVTTSESDEKQLYRDTYADGLESIWKEVITTKRSNLYKDKTEAEHCVRRRICIANRRTDLNDIGTGSYNMRSPLWQFLMEEYDRLLQAGYIKETEGQNGRTLCRWINKKEEKELTKARREAEKAKKERKAASKISDTEKAFREALTIKVGDRVTSKHYHQTGTVTSIRQEKGEMVYDVKFDKPVKSFWTEQDMKETTFGRYAITKNYDTATGCEIEGTAIYYAEELQADFWLSNSRTIFGMEIFKPTDRRPSWLVVADIFSEPKKMTLREVCDMLAARYQEEHKAA